MHWNARPRPSRSPAPRRRSTKSRRPAGSSPTQPTLSCSRSTRTASSARAPRRRAAARLQGRGAGRARGLLAPAPRRPALARERPTALRPQGRQLRRPRGPAPHAPRRARLRRRRRHGPSRHGRPDIEDGGAADPGCRRARARSRSSSSRSSPRRSRSTCTSTQLPSSASRRAASGRSSAPASRAARCGSSPARPCRSRRTSRPRWSFAPDGLPQAPRRSASVRGSGAHSSPRLRTADRLAALALAAQPAIGFADASAQLSALATRDQLTNLPDHRAFHEQLRSEARRAERHERALSLVLINIDDFKQINAEHGRLAGDRALAEVGRRLAATVRNGELVSRLSADHFGWVLPETEGLSGWIAAERGRRALAAAPIEGDRHDHRVRRRLRLRGCGRLRRAARARRGGARPRQGLGRQRNVPLQRRARRRRRRPPARGRPGPRPAPCPRARARRRGPGHRRSLRAGLPRRREARAVVRLESRSRDPPRPGSARPRRRQAQHRRGRAPQARPALEGRARADPEPPRHGRGDRRQGARLGAARLDPAPPRALGRRRAIRTVSPARQSRSAHACSRSPKHGTR